MQDNDFRHHVTHVVEQGYTILPLLLTSEECAEAVVQLDRLYALRDRGGLELIFNKARIFERLYQIAPLLRIVRHFLGDDALLSSMHGSVLGPGEGKGGLHADGSITGHNRARSMADDDGDMVYELTLPLTGDTLEYKFAIGNWEDEEDLEAEASCALTNYDEGAPNGCCYVNRFVVLESDAVVQDVVCWNSCQACGAEPVAGCTDAEACNYNAEASTDDGSCVYGDGPTAGFEVTDALCADGTGLLSLDSASIDLYAAGVTFQVGEIELVYGALDLAAGSYTLTATDSLGCSSDSAFVVEAPAPIEILITVTDDPGDGTGSAEIYPVGGFGPITWTVLDVIGMPADLNALSAGTYTVTAVDENGCTALSMRPRAMS